MTDLTEEMCIRWMTTETNLDSFAITLFWERTLHLAGSLTKQH